MNDIRLTQILKDVDRNKLPDNRFNPYIDAAGSFKDNENHFKKEFKAFSIRVLVNIAIGLALIIIYYIYR
jgi:isopenicillin N synthase-like dioxygenase